MLWFELLRSAQPVHCATSVTYQDFNGAPGNLRWDGQSLEERCLLRSQTSVSFWHKYINRGNGSCLSRGSHLVGQNPVTDNCQVVLGEDEPHITLDVWEKPTTWGKKETAVMFTPGLVRNTSGHLEGKWMTEWLFYGCLWLLLFTNYTASVILPQEICSILTRETLKNVVTHPELLPI